MHASVNFVELLCNILTTCEELVKIWTSNVIAAGQQLNTIRSAKVDIYFSNK